MKLRTGILGLALTSVVALASANAADMYVPGPAGPGGYKDVPYAEVNWSGFYLGAHIGGAWATDKVTDVHDDWGVGGSFNNDTSGVFGGGQLGYNFQMGHFVFGPEIDLGYMDLDHAVDAPANKGGTNVVSTVQPGFYADVTGRLGYAIDRALVYAKGGYAYYGGGVKNWTSDIPGSTTTTGLSGWTAGAGIEYKINPSWSLKAEYQHFDFGSATNDVPRDPSDCGIAAGTVCPYKNQLSVDTVKVGVNYFVNSGYVPLK